MVSTDDESATDHNQYVIVTVKSASLRKNYEKPMSSMDPFCTISFISPHTPSTSTCKVFVSRTATQWSAHKTPTFNHTCPGHAYNPNDCVEIALYEDGRISKPDHMGCAQISVAELLGPSPKPGKSTSDVDLPIFYSSNKKGHKMEQRQNGTVKVTAVLVDTDTSIRSLDSHMPISYIDPPLFKSPVKRLGVSGGTAPFFALELVRPHVGKSSSHYIGKDLSRAVDEIKFYEEMLALLSSNAGEAGLRDLLSFAFEYKGVLKVEEEGVVEGDPMRELLVLRNLKDGCATLRLLDLKMGHRTASANWQGKSWSHAKRQSIMDKGTNSCSEGYRLEGVEGSPKTLLSMDPLLDYIGLKEKDMHKKASRMMLQRMDGNELLIHFLDLHLDLPDTDIDLDVTYGNAELAEMVLHEVVSRLAKLCAVCHNVKVPQKWVGSSCALGYDSGILPSREKTEEAIRSTVLVNIFDWGRSELCLLDKYHHMSPEEQTDRTVFWNSYKGGMERLGWEAARTYLHRFGNSGQWSKIELAVYDFNAMSNDYLIATVVIPVEETDLTEVELATDSTRSKLKTMVGGPPMKLSYSMHWRPCPSGSRLKGTWRVGIHSAKDLHNKEITTESDPYCLLKAVSTDGKHAFHQVTRVIQKNLNPTWDETLDLPIASDPGALKKALESGKAGLGEGDLFEVLPMDKRVGTPLRSSTIPTVSQIMSNYEDDAPAISEWGARLMA